MTTDVTVLQSLLSEEETATAHDQCSFFTLSDICTWSSNYTTA